MRFRTFVGIDLAGDSGETGVAVICKNETNLSYEFPSGSWKGLTGLEGMVELVRISELTAVDQPFSL